MKSKHNEQELSEKEKWITFAVTGLFAAIGAIFGIIAYYGQSLG